MVVMVLVLLMVVMSPVSTLRDGGGGTDVRGYCAAGFVCVEVDDIVNFEWVELLL